MSTIRSTILLYTKLEEALRKAAATNSYVTINQLFSIPEIKNAATGLQQLRDCLMSMQKKECLLQKSVNPREHGGNTQAYMWKEGAEFALARSNKSVKTAKAPSAAIVTKVAKPILNEVEIVLNGITVIVGTNPVTGRIRMMIEG